MKSTSLNYYIGLDHVRAVAAYLVFCWHFLHTTNGVPIAFDNVEVLPPLSWLNQGHLGVSVFMVLSGYLFAKILDDARVDYLYFYINRFLRLAPLMIFVVFINATMRYLNDEPAVWYFFASLVNGLLHPSLPNAGWSITAEFHFYLLLPFLLWFSRRSNYNLVFLLVLAVILRAFLYWRDGSVQYLGYWTIVGRFDLFVIGILAYRCMDTLQRPAVIVGGALFSLAALYAYINHLGGYHGTQKSVIWIVFAAMEGVCIAPLIYHYDRISVRFTGPISRFVANIGKYSYSMYLLHSFIVFKAATYIHFNVLNLSNIYVAIAVSTLVFLIFVPISYISYTLVEKPFLRFRIPYLK